MVSETLISQASSDRMAYNKVLSELEQLEIKEEERKRVEQN